MGRDGKARKTRGAVPEAVASAKRDWDSGRLMAALAAAKLGVWELDIRTRRVYLSPESYEIMGRPAGDGSLDSYVRSVHPDDLARVRRLFDRAVIWEKEFRAEFRYLRPDGAVPWLAATARTYMDDEGQPRRMLGTIQDVTRRRISEEAIRKSEERYRAVVEDQAEAIARFLADGTLTFVNEVYCRVFGKLREELLGRKWQALTHPDDVRMVEDRLRSLSPSNPVAVAENRIHEPSGRIRWMQFVHRGQFDGKGRLVETRCVGRDVTERREAQETARDYARRLVELDEKLRKMLAADLHDEVGQMLAALGIQLRVIAGSLPPDSLKNVGPAVEETERLVRGIVASLRGIREGLRPADLDDFGLSTAVRNMAEEFSKRTGIRVSFRCGKGFPRLPALREVSLYRIAQEALANVAKHAGAKRAEVRLAVSRGKLLLSIRDAGKGFDPAGKRPGADSGWGLTFMRERARMLGGTFRVESTPGEGTRVSVELGGG